MLRGGDILLIAGLSALLASCGIVAPRVSEIWDADIPKDFTKPNLPMDYPADSRLEFEILRRVYCDVWTGVRAANQLPAKRGTALDKMKVVRTGLIPPGWAAQVSLSLAAAEASSLNPGVSLIAPLANVVTNPGSAHPVINSQSSSVGLSATFSSTATKTTKVDPFWSLDIMRNEPDDQSWCKIDEGTGTFRNDPFDIAKIPRTSSSPLIIDSDLGISEWIFGSMVNWVLLDSTGAGPKHADKAGPGPDTITLEINFVIVTSASVTPTWKLVRVSANTGQNFFGIGRTRTHDLIITIGPQNDRTNRSFNAAQIGQEVRGR